MTKIMTNKYYKQIDVWQKMSDNEIICFRCFEIMPDGLFCVQSADFYDKDSIRNRVGAIENQYLELLLEDEPDNREGAYETLLEAIEAHQNAFE